MGTFIVKSEYFVNFVNFVRMRKISAKPILLWGKGTHGSLPLKFQGNWPRIGGEMNRFVLKTQKMKGTLTGI